MSALQTSSSAARFWRLLPPALALGLLACAAPGPPPDRDGGYLDRSVEKAHGGISVKASVLARQEITEVFGVRMDRVGIQPVWLRIQNLSADSYVLFLKSIDPDYFSPYEVARRSAGLSERSAEDIYPFLRDREIPRFIAPGAEVEGFVYTHVDEGLKAINVDFVGHRRITSFNMVIEVPGLTTDSDDFDPVEVYAFQRPALSEVRLRSWLKSQPCCAAAADGTPGDPLNLVLVGGIEEVRAALVAQHWDVTAEVTGASLRRIMTSYVFGSRYRYAPVSDLYVFGRKQDMSFQKARALLDERNHIRIWLAPVTFEGVPVWVGHVSRDAGIKFSGRFWPPTTHVIDPAVDEARFYVEQDLVYSQRVERIGLVEGVGAAPAERPRRNAEGDPYFTDGFRAVFFIGGGPTSIDDLRVLDWSLPAELEPFRENIFAPPAAPFAGR